MGFRSLMRRAAKPAAMVAVIGALSLSLVVTTPSTAQALSSRDVKAAETFVMGATKTIAPAANVALAAASFTPVGMGIRLAQLGFLAYSTSDIWWPVVAGAWGAATGNENTPAEGGAWIQSGLVYQQSAAKMEGHRVHVYVYYGTTESSEVNVGIMGRTSCKRPDGSTYNHDSSAVGLVTTGSNHAYASRNLTLTVTCGTSNDVAIGYVVGSPDSTPELGCGGYRGGACGYRGPETVQRGGTQVTGDAGFDPHGADVKYIVRSECISPDGTIATVEAESSGDYMRMPSCEAAGLGHGTGKTAITGLAPGKTVEQPLWSSPVAPSDPSTPLCDASRPGSGCILSVEIDGKPCGPENIECQNWAEVQKNDPNNTRLKCRFGPYTLPMSACAALEKAYWPGGAPANEENTDGNPDTSRHTAPTGSPSLAPQTPTQTAPAVGTLPGVGGSPSAVPGASEQESACWPTGWGMLNPLEWVYKPVVCAAKAMFQPTKSVQTRVTTMQAGFANKIPMTWFGAGVEGVSGGACPTNWAVTLHGHSYSLICGTPADGIIQSFRPILGAMLIVAMLWPLIRSLFYAAIPVFKVNPS